MEHKGKKRGGISLGAMSAKLLDPLMRKRVGINVELLANWSEIVGQQMAETSEPVKVIWAKRRDQADDYEPATLIVACEGFSAMKLTHESNEVMNRINRFFGYAAIGRIKIEQRPVSQEPTKKPRMVEVSTEIEQELKDMTADVIDPKLRESLIEFGRAFYSDKKFRN